MRITENQSHTETVKSVSQIDPNINLVSVKFNYDSIFYSPYTAGYAYLSLQSETTMDVALKLEPVPLSYVSPSAFVYDELDLESEKLTSLIFMKSVADLEASEFIRSPVFRFYFDNYEYNHFLLGPFEFMVTFNKIRNFPDPDITAEELEKLRTEADLNLDVTDPSNYYCLASYNELTRTWACISRNILSISENKIEFAAVTTGIFAVIYCPKVDDGNPQFCGFVCRHKKAIMTTLMVLVPVLLIVGGFIWSLFWASYRTLEEKIKLVNTDENEAIVKPGDGREDTDDEGVGVETAKHAYNNPLLFQEDTHGSDINALELSKQRLRFKDEKLLAEKLKQLRKNLSLRNELESIRDGIAQMKVLQGQEAFNRGAES